MICSLNPSMFSEKEHRLLESDSYSATLFRYRSGVEAVRISAGRGEFIWLPYLGQQLWDWKIDGESQKFGGFVEEPSYGKNFLQNYGGFLIHCGMTAMGNPGPQDTHLHHGELPVSRFDEAWIEVRQQEGGEELSLCGSLHWKVPFIAEYRCFPSLRLAPDGLSMRAEVRLKNPAQARLDYMYLAHINFSFAGARRLLSTMPFDHEHVVVRDAALPGIEENPESLKRIDPAADYAPELVAIVDGSGSSGETIASALLRDDDSTFWVSQEKTGLDHYVVWMTRTADRGACGFQLPSTAGPRGFEAEKALGNIKSLSPGEEARLRFACGFCDARGGSPLRGAAMSDRKDKETVMNSDMGSTQWVYPDLELPPPGDSPLKGHESLIVLNMNEADVGVVLTVFFTDKEPIELPPLKVAARRVRCLRLDRAEEIGLKIPRETQYALRIKADLPVVAQYGRLDTRQQNMAFYTVMGFNS